MMKKSQCEITNIREMFSILERSRIGRLATLGEDGYPYITPLNYVFCQGGIYFHCAHEGEKIDNIMRDSRVCFEVDIPLAYLDTKFDPEASACQVHQFYHSVVIRGRAEIVEDIEEKVSSLNALMAAHEGDPEFSAITNDTPAVAACTVVAIRVETMSGKSDLAQKKSNDQKKKIAEYLRQRDLQGDQEAADIIGV